MLLIEDHRFYADGLRLLLEKTFADCRVTVVADMASALLSDPDIALIIADIVLKQDRSLAKIKALRDRFPKARLVTMTGYDDARFGALSQSCGADGFFLKRESPAQIAATLMMVLNGKRVFPALVEGTGLPMDALTEREREIMSMISLGRSNLEIARTLGISIKTVKTHVTNSFRKLGVSSRMEAAMLFREDQGLPQVAEPLPVPLQSDM